MTALYVDGWDWGTVVADRWITTLGQGSLDIQTPGRYASGSYLRTLVHDNVFGGGPSMVKRAIGTQTNVIIGMAVNVVTPRAALPMIELLSGAANVFDVRMDSANCLYLTRNNGTQVGPTSAVGGPGQLTNNTWVYLELKVAFSATVGMAELRVRGTTVVSASGVNTGGVSYDTLLLGALLGGGDAGDTFQEIHWDDLYVLNSAGTQNNDFLGERRVLVRAPTGAGTYQQWSQSGATAGQPWTAVTSDDGDTSYIAANVAGFKETFVGTAVQGNVSQINAVQFMPIARKDDAGFRHLAGYIKSGSSEVAVGDFNLSSGYVSGTSVPGVQETDPATGAAWTPAGLNAAELGVELVS